MELQHSKGMKDFLNSMRLQFREGILGNEVLMLVAP